MPEENVQPPALSWFQGRLNALEEENVERNKQFDAIDQMIHVDWQMPIQIKNLGWAFKQVELIFRQAVAAAKRILADVTPKISIIPSETTEESDVHDVLNLYDNARLRALAQEIVNRQWKCRLRQYVSYDWRAVWVEIGPAPVKRKSSRSGNTLPMPLTTAEQTIELVREEWLWPFLPWVVRLGGSSLETRSDYKRRALLSDAYYANLFETLNRIKTLRYSEMLRWAGSEKRFFQSDSNEAPDSNPSAATPYLKIGTDEKVGDLNPPMPDPGLGLLYTENRADVQRSTL